MADLEPERLAAFRAESFRTGPGLQLATFQDAVDFVNARGFVFFWPVKGANLPSLWAAVAGDRPVADEHAVEVPLPAKRVVGREVAAYGLRRRDLNHLAVRGVLPPLEVLGVALLAALRSGRLRVLGPFTVRVLPWRSLRRAGEPGGQRRVPGDLIRLSAGRKRIVLIGHSMGGMICRLMITDAGDKIWRDFFATPPAKTPLTSDTRKLLEEALIFNHRPDVQRVIFISTPHRGSKLAAGWIGRIGAALVRTPQRFVSIYASTKPLLVADPAARPLNRMPNSVDTLEPNDRFVEAVNKLPITRNIPYHSIIGDRGKGDSPNSTDGVVAYWSSHLDGAQSEVIVPGPHGSCELPQTIAELDRILRLHLGAGVKPRATVAQATP